MTKIKKMLYICALASSIMLFQYIFCIDAYAKPISNTLKAFVTVVDKDNEGGGAKEDEPLSINEAVKRAKDGDTVMINGGEYHLDEALEDKDVILESKDGKFVDINVPKGTPLYTKLKVGDMVTVNIDGVTPVELKAAIKGDSVFLREYSDEDFSFEVNKNKQADIYFEKEVINPLGFKNSNLIIKVEPDIDVIVKRQDGDKTKRVNKDSNNTYNLGDMGSNLKVKLIFEEPSDYSLSMWLDNGR